MKEEQVFILEDVKNIISTVAQNTGELIPDPYEQLAQHPIVVEE